MITIPMTQAKFDKVKAMLEVSPEIASKSELSAIAGSFSTNQVSFNYTYNAATSDLYLDLTAKHGLAHFASEDTIAADINKMLESV